MTHDAVEADDGLADSVADHPAPDGHLFPTAFPVAGMLHILHNTFKELTTECMQDWGKCLEALK
eukprot:938446-Alexandrium_andersonii.AAC.1